ncbi:MAG: zinc-binding dehydrogenase [Propionibacteriaceae bacterium]|jgi:L-iditol 2-dehydrogenase|nr:zinc-binding dehydrogenase [Propionibacteriaceae bacterium]
MMKAAVMHGPSDIRYEDWPDPLCPPGGFRLKIEAVGLCGSDIRNLTTDSKKGAYPHIYGHEVVGQVVETDTGKYRLGEHVYVYPAAHCLKCENCRAGHHEQCTEVDEYTDHPGGFAEYISYDATRVERGATFELPEGTDPVLAVMAEPLSSTYACIENIDVQLGETVAILGSGPVGVLLAVLSKLRGAHTVIADVSGERLKLAEDFGIDHLIDSSTLDPVEAIREITGGRGADKVISANPSPSAQNQAIEMAKKSGTVVFFGGIPKGTLAQIDSNLVHYNGLWIYGHYGANSPQVEKAFQLAISDQFPAAQFVTHVLPLSEINQAIELTRSGQALKVVLKP